LADHGARVIKVESPDGGDLARTAGPYHPDDVQGADAGYFHSINRNKESVALDLKSPQGREVFLRLVDRSDIVVENFRAGTMDKLGLGYEAVAVRNPRIIYGAILAIGQTDVMRLISYTSISHFGFIILGIFVMTSQGQSGSTLYMVNHGIATAALFLIAGFLVSRRGTRAIADYGGVQKVAPVLAGTFLIAGLATLALPGLAPFISEFLVLIGTFTRYPVFAVLAALGLVLSAVYVLWMYQRMMTGPVTEGNESLTDLRPRELIVVAPLIALLLVLGVYPKPALDVINPAVTDTLTRIGQTDPAPALRAAE
jgi:NADH-quinone oxidoreductase subunit M